jgi:hypothetical protein
MRTPLVACIVLTLLLNHKAPVDGEYDGNPQHAKDQVAASGSRQMQDEPTPLPAECADADLKKLGQPVMVDICGWSKVFWGFSVGTGRAISGQQVPLYFWLVNQSDQPQTLGSCELDWYFKEGFDVFDASGNRLRTKEEQKHPQYPRSQVDEGEYFCTRDVPVPMAAHTCIKSESPYNLADAYVLPEGEYAVSPRKTLECNMSYREARKAPPRVHPGRLTISIEPPANRP